MVSDIPRGNNVGINDTLVGTIPSSTNLAAGGGFTNTIFAKSPDFHIHNIGRNSKNEIHKGISVQKYLSHKKPEFKGWLDVGTYPSDIGRFLFDTILSGFTPGDRVGSVHVKYYCSFRMPN